MEVLRKLLLEGLHGRTVDEGRAGDHLQQGGIHLGLYLFILAEQIDHLDGLHGPWKRIGGRPVSRQARREGNVRAEPLDVGRMMVGIRSKASMSTITFASA